MAINFFTEEIKFDLTQKLKRKGWIKELAKTENFRIGELNFIFCSDEYLYRINVDYLNHHTYTDIITFDNAEEAKLLEGDIFISIDRVRENGQKHIQDESSELSRVISHGVFHLMGYKDKTKEDAAVMREREAYAIELFKMF